MAMNNAVDYFGTKEVAMTCRKTLCVSALIFGLSSPVEWSPQGIVPTHYHLHNPDFKWTKETIREHGYTPEQAIELFKQIAPKFDIKIHS